MIVKLPTAPEPWRQSGSDLARTIVVAGGADPGPPRFRRTQCVPASPPPATTAVAQMLGYLNITGLDLALLLNFKNARLEWKRVLRPREAGEHDTPDLHA